MKAVLTLYGIDRVIDIQEPYPSFKLPVPADILSRSTWNTKMTPDEPVVNEVEFILVKVLNDVAFYKAKD